MLHIGGKIIIAKNVNAHFDLNFTGWDNKNMAH